MDSVWGKPNSIPVRDVLSLVQPSLVKFIIIIIIIIIINPKGDSLAPEAGKTQKLTKIIDKSNFVSQKASSTLKIST